MRQLFDSMKRHASESGELIAVSDQHGQLSRRELFAGVTALAADLKDQPRTIGICAPNGLGWVTAQLACALAGKIAVPMPTFFSPAQLGHVVRDASVELIHAAEQTAALADQSGVPTKVIGIHRLGAAVPGAGVPDVIDGFGQIIYTSGSTGQPKGVRHQSGQIAWSAAALGSATGARATDSYLSVLPLPLLLEMICSIFIPASLGAYVHFDGGLAERIGQAMRPALPRRLRNSSTDDECVGPAIAETLGRRARGGQPNRAVFSSIRGGGRRACPRSSLRTPLALRNPRARRLRPFGVLLGRFSEPSRRTSTWHGRSTPDRALGVDR